MVRNIDVVDKWMKGRKGKNRNMRTDGSRLWSYNLLIGFKDVDGYRYVYNYSASPMLDWKGKEVKGRFVSMTTSKHVWLAYSCAYAVEPPKKGE